VRRSGRAAAALLLILLCAAGIASAQKPTAKQPYGLIFGTVYDPSDVPVYGAVVQIRTSDGGKVKGGEKLISDHRGEFALRVPAAPADYVVHAEIKNGGKHLSGKALVHINFDERADVGVHLTE
jgi:hypothetical protein